MGNRLLLSESVDFGVSWLGREFGRKGALHAYIFPVGIMRN